jgi:hypothetical protein
MSDLEFHAFPKIPRLFRDCTISEKIDGTNAAVGIKAIERRDNVPENITTAKVFYDGHGGAFAVYAQSRSRIITPGKQTDNHGFAAWVHENAPVLVSTLGPGLHYGEWWGNGINRGYGLPRGEKRFSLFNTNRWTRENLENSGLPELGVVPVLYQGLFTTDVVSTQVERLRTLGSVAAPGFMNPEGVVTHHEAGRNLYKTLVENDQLPKGA